MSDFRNRLYADYLKHYQGANTNVDPTSVNRNTRRSWSKTWSARLEKTPSELPILDIGCGTGFLAHWLATTQQRPVIGIDASSEQIETAQRFTSSSIPSSELKFEAADGHAYLTNSTQQYAAIFCTDVIEHLTDSELHDWLSTIRSRLAPGSTFCCRTPNASNVLGFYSRHIDATHTRCFTPASLRQILHAYGFSKIEVFAEEPAHLAGKIRQWTECQFHKFLFRLTGRSSGFPYDRNVCAIAMP